MEVNKVLVLGLDGLEPTLVQTMMDRGQLPHFAQLRARGGLARVGTTYPAQTPVAWSTFATGTNPGGHGIFDFLRRNPETYLPDLSLNRYEQTSSLAPPKVVNLRRGTALWEMLSARGIPSTVIRCPCTYPTDPIRGRMLAGMGVPDLRGSLGTPTFYTTLATARAGESETLVHLSSETSPISSHVVGPAHPRTRKTCEVPFTLHPDYTAQAVTIQSQGQPRQLQVRLGEWSDWLHLKFKLGFLQSISGMIRFRLARLEPHIELYASPINFDPAAPLFPISTPAAYASTLAQEIGSYYTAGMIEDHGGLTNGRLSEFAFLEQCEQVMRERERMMIHELNRFTEGFFFCLFDTPDRVQHMFWRFSEPEHPANGSPAHDEFRHVIEEQYRRCDATVGQALQFVDDKTLLIVLSDHGFGSFQRGVNLNTWLYEAGLLKLKSGVAPGPDTARFFRNVDWHQTKAYALGLAGIFFNRRGRESNGVLDETEADRLETELIDALPGLRDPVGGEQPIRSAIPRNRIYRGPYVNEAPDLIVNFAPRYRVSWSTALGGIAAEVVEDNRKKWSGDHIIDPLLVPGVLLMNRPFDATDPRLVDMAPTILAALGVSKSEAMEGRALLRGASEPIAKEAMGTA